MAVNADIALEMQFSGSDGAWTDVAADVLTRGKIRAKYGIQRGGPLDRVQGIGTMDWWFNNSTTNSGGLDGYYSPNHSDVRSGFDLGIHARLKLTYSGSTRYKWAGRLSSAEPQPGKYRDRRTICQAVDWFDIASKNRVRLVDVAFDQRADEGIASIIDSITDKPSASSLAAGQDTFPTVFDTTRDESTTIIREMTKLANSELGYLYMSGDETTGGVLTFEDRHARPKYGATAASLSGCLTGFKPERRTRYVYNRIKVQANPRETSTAASVLFTLQSVPLIGAAASTIIEGAYTDPEQRGAIRIGGASMVTPASTTDYAMWTASDGTGTDLTADFSVAASYGGNSVRYSISNDGNTAGYITLLQARGYVIAVKEPTIAEKVDQTSIDTYGEAVLRAEMPYQESPLVTEDASNSLLANWKDPVTILSDLEFVANECDGLMQQMLLREPGDKITVTETITGVDKDYFINGVELTIRDKNTIICKWALAPAETTNFWILGIVGSSELDQTTVLGY